MLLQERIRGKSGYSCLLTNCYCKITFKQFFQVSGMDSPEVRRKLEQVNRLRAQYNSKTHRTLSTLSKELDSIKPISAAKKVPNVDEPEKCPDRCFRDYLLAEIIWLHNDMALEKKWKLTQARKVVKDTLKHRYIVEREAGVDISEQQLRKVSSILATEVEKFWKGVRQLAQHRFSKVEARIKREENQKRLDELVDRTEEFVKGGRKRSRSEAMEEPTPEPSMELDGSSKTALLDKISKEMAEAAPTGNSFSTTSVSIPVPSLIRANLREYQHIGMEWLAALHERNLNGILADEMGLGKTLQTISLLAHLAEHKGIWGPHLIIVPTSVMINWEIEFKKFLPGFKVMVYFGSPKERREKRVGWAKDELIFNVCICSYALVLQDALVFRKKNWHYLILDEAHQIKNFKSLRWQNLLTFKTERRLLLTGTPLQNDLIELWSLLHFLMPKIFTSHLEFQQWFSDPLSKAIEHSKLDEHGRLINRLHSLIRPFLLRRLKKDVETQMPSKYEHVIPVALSRRQQVLYDEFLSHRETRQLLKQGKDYLGLMNVLMQLRKVCNHPNLLEPRPVRSPFVMALNEVVAVPSSRRFESLVDLPARRPFWFIEISEGKYECHRASQLAIRSSAESLGREIRPILHQIFSNQAKVDSGNAESYLENPYIKERSTRRSKKGSRVLTPSSNYSGPLLGRDGIAIAETMFVYREETLGKDLVKSAKDRLEDCWNVWSQFMTYTLSVITSPAMIACGDVCKEYWDLVHFPDIQRRCLRPDRRFLEWDCGKFRLLHSLLGRLRAENHKVILFTQMSKMLDVIEAFANLCGFTYVRLDGGTKVTDRQLKVDRFNRDKKLFLFISSTRAGGVGINLTGADTVVFFDSDWNPAMDRQAMDRCHRIGQVKDVHVYRLVSEKTIEENIFVKQLQKRQLDHVVIDQGQFGGEGVGGEDVTSPAFLKMGTSKTGGVSDLIQGLFQAPPSDSRSDIYGTHVLWERPEEGAVTGTPEEELFSKVEDEEDVCALKIARKETELSETAAQLIDVEQAADGQILHAPDEDPQYLQLPAIVRRSVDLIEAHLIAERRTEGVEENEEEWEELEEAEWSSEDEEELEE